MWLIQTRYQDVGWRTDVNYWAKAEMDEAEAQVEVIITRCSGVAHLTYEMGLLYEMSFR